MNGSKSLLVKGMHGKETQTSEKDHDITVQPVDDMTLQMHRSDNDTNGKYMC